MDRPKALSSRGRRVQHLSSQPLYYYAEALDGRVTWEGDGRITARIGNIAYRLRQANPTLVRGHLQVRLTCNGDGGGSGGGLPKS